MTRFSIYFSLLTISLLVLVSCNKDDDNDKPETTSPKVVINELMPSNAATVYDQNGEYDDWIELYNLTDSVLDISGYYLSDSRAALTKWQFPEETTILPDSFLIIWADSDTLQSGLHANFKLAAGGETVYLLSPEAELLDMVKFGAQPIEIGQAFVELSFARIPNGTGTFTWVKPTWNNRNVKQ